MCLECSILPPILMSAEELCTRINLLLVEHGELSGFVCGGLSQTGALASGDKVVTLCAGKTFIWICVARLLLSIIFTS